MPFTSQQAFSSGSEFVGTQLSTVDLAGNNFTGQGQISGFLYPGKHYLQCEDLS
jgi:hypothetical protein